MNRRAKRNKYKKLQRELERRIETFNARSRFEHCFSKDVKIQQISCFKPIEEYSRLPADTIKEYYKKEIAEAYPDFGKRVGFKMTSFDEITPQAHLCQCQ